ncbi:MAG TPA: hypothetical protein VE865_16520, partial [Bradyrhizobium sp.]|nr:hypothetical protein [Bradyrhizobium sp.]
PDGRPEATPSRSEEAARLAELEGQTGREAMLPRILAWQILIAETLRNNLSRVADTLTRIGWDESFELVVGYVALAPAQYADQLIGDARRNEDHVFGAALFDYRGRHDRPTRRSMDMGELDHRLRGLPLVYVPVANVFHTVPDVYLATSTCWAANSPGGKPDHILTAAHNVSWQGPGRRVAFNGGLTGQVVQSTTHPVDAALIAPNFSPSVLSAQIAVEPVPVLTEPFSFDGSKSGAVYGKVTLVHVVPGVAHPYSPQRVYLDTAGQSGDSGALVRSRRSGRALGIYTGTLKARGVTYIHSQAMEQACTLLAIDLWE